MNLSEAKPISGRTTYLNAKTKESDALKELESTSHRDDKLVDFFRETMFYQEIHSQQDPLDESVVSEFNDLDKADNMLNYTLNIIPDDNDKCKVIFTNETKEYGSIDSKYTIPDEYIQSVKLCYSSLSIQLHFCKTVVRMYSLKCVYDLGLNNKPSDVDEPNRIGDGILYLEVNRNKNIPNKLSLVNPRNFTKYVTLDITSKLSINNVRPNLYYVFAYDASNISQVYGLYFGDVTLAKAFMEPIPRKYDKEKETSNPLKKCKKKFRLSSKKPMISAPKDFQLNLHASDTSLYCLDI